MDLRATLSFAALALALALLLAAAGASPDNRTLSRRRRYLTFPEGSTYSFAFCMEMKTLTQDYDLYSEGVAISANYELPSKPEQLFASSPKMPPQALRRRHRRDLYAGIERVLNLAGLDGRQCVLLALCEASRTLTPGVGMIEEMIRLLFTVPLEHMSRDEPHEHWQYGIASRSESHPLTCEELYPRCPISLLSIIMNLQPANMYFE